MSSIKIFYLSVITWEEGGGAPSEVSGSGFGVRIEWFIGALGLEVDVEGFRFLVWGPGSRVGGWGLRVEG